jgi:phosphohistidine phosphatase
LKRFVAVTAVHVPGGPADAVPDVTARPTSASMRKRKRRPRIRADRIRVLAIFQWRVRRVMLSLVRTLYLLRHAKSSWDDAALADENRPLAPRGRKAARKVAAYMDANGIRPDLVLCSPALRTRQTLELVRGALGTHSDVRHEPALYGADEQELLEVVRGLPDAARSALVIGHNPGLQRFALELARSGDGLERLREKMPTAALAALDLDAERWVDVTPASGVLTGYVVPADL